MRLNSHPIYRLRSGRRFTAHWAPRFLASVVLCPTGISFAMSFQLPRAGSTALSTLCFRYEKTAPSGAIK
jgi:hypothetical protein